MVIGSSKVPMFKLRPYRGMLVAAAFVMVVGSLISAYFFMEEADSYDRNGLFALVLTIAISLCLVIVAFSRYGFKHLHHRRPGYKRG